MLTMIDEFSRICLDVPCARHIGADEVITQLANAMIAHGIPEYIRSDNGLPAESTDIDLKNIPGTCNVPNNKFQLSATFT